MKDLKIHPSLADGEKRNAKSSGTFEIPALSDRIALEPGDHAKVLLESEDGGERVWVEVTASDSGVYTGALANWPVVRDWGVEFGGVLCFEPRHVIGVMRKGEMDDAEETKAKDALVSDLFFGHSHSEARGVWEKALKKKDEVGAGELLEALTLDAQAWWDQFEPIVEAFQPGWSIERLVDEFLGRL